MCASAASSSWRLTEAGSRNSRSAWSWSISASRMKLRSGANGRRKSSVNRSISALRQYASDEVIGGHGAVQADIDPPSPVAGQVLDRLLHFALPVGLHEEGNMDSVQLMGWLPHDAGDAMPLDRVSQRPRVLTALRRDRGVDNLSELD